MLTCQTRRLSILPFEKRRLNNLRDTCNSLQDGALLYCRGKSIDLEVLGQLL